MYGEAMKPLPGTTATPAVSKRYMAKSVSELTRPPLGVRLPSTPVQFAKA